MMNSYELQPEEYKEVMQEFHKHTVIGDFISLMYLYGEDVIMEELRQRKMEIENTMQPPMEIVE